MATLGYAQTQHGIADVEAETVDPGSAAVGVELANSGEIVNEIAGASENDEDYSALRQWEFVWVQRGADG